MIKILYDKIMKNKTGGCPMIHVMICDDDQESIERIQKCTHQYLEESSTKAEVFCFEDPIKISPTLLKSIDIAFLDIDFHNTVCNGIQLAGQLRQVRPDAVIIFITNFIEYAPEGYEVRAFRYILKDKLEENLRRFFPLAIQELQKTQEVFKITIEGEILDIPVDDILYLEVQQHDITLYCRQGKQYVFHESLTKIEQQLHDRGFLRIHNSYLVNMKQIRKFQCREALLLDGTVLRVSEKNYAENKKKYLLWKGCV